MRDRAGLLPLAQNARILVIEQRLPDKTLGQNANMHRLSFTEAMYGYSMELLAADTEFSATDSDKKIINSVMNDVDIVVATNHFFRGEPENNSAMMRELIAAGKKLVLITNTPYEFSALPEAGTVICTFSSTPESLRIAAGIVFGAEKPEGTWPLKHYVANKA